MIFNFIQAREAGLHASVLATMEAWREEGFHPFYDDETGKIKIVSTRPGEVSVQVSAWTPPKATFVHLVKNFFASPDSVSPLMAHRLTSGLGVYEIAKALGISRQRGQFILHDGRLSLEMRSRVEKAFGIPLTAWTLPPRERGERGKGKRKGNDKRGTTGGDQGQA